MLFFVEEWKFTRRIKRMYSYKEEKHKNMLECKVDTLTEKKKIKKNKT